jgi:ATP synthase protein I
MAKPPDRRNNEAPPDPNSPAPQDTPPGDSDLSAWYRLSGVGLEFIAAVLLCGGAGWWLDRHLGTSPWLMIVGGAVGFGAGMWLLIKASQSLFR